MSGLLPAIGLALWLGVLTSVSPCPLASNIAAVSWLGSQPGRPKRVLLAGLLYTLGRIVAYSLIGTILSLGVLSISAISFSLQRYGSMALGPLLVVVGMFLLGFIRIRLPAMGILADAAERTRRWGLWSAPLIGLLFALSFCPVSAAIFFGSLVPLAARSRLPFAVPAVYGIGTAVPVVLLSIALAIGGDAVSRRYNRLSRFEGFARKLTGIVFMGAGAYLMLKYIFNVVP